MKSHAFLRDYGVYVEDLGIAARCICIVNEKGEKGEVAYQQLVPEVAEEPYYDEVINQAKELGGVQFPIMWSIIGGTLFVLLLRLLPR